MNNVYQRVHLGLFRKPLIEIIDTGFIYDGQTYTQAEITEIRLAGGNGSPRLLTVVLSDGKKISINSAALELNGKRYRNGFISGTNDAFEKIKTYFIPSQNSNHKGNH